MNAVPSFSPLPDLNPEDHALLTRYFSLNEDLTKLAAEPNRPDFLFLLRWLSRPEIAAYIAAYRTHQTHLHRQAVITALQTVLNTSTDQIEIRRAATTLLRALNPRPVPSKSVPPTSMPSVRADGRRPSVSPGHVSPSSPTGEGASAAGGGGSVSTAFSTHSPHTRGTPSRHGPLNRSVPIPPSPVHPPTPSSPPPLTSAPHTTSPTSLADALAILGPPTDLAELDRLDDEADDAEDDAELDAYADWNDNPDPNNST